MSRSRGSFLETLFIVLPFKASGHAGADDADVVAAFIVSHDQEPAAIRLTEGDEASLLFRV
jgi:hypothetical protein